MDFIRILNTDEATLDCLPCVGKSTLSVVSFAPYSWFEEWKDGKVQNRGAEYKELKATIMNSVLEVLTQIFPKIKDRV